MATKPKKPTVDEVQEEKAEELLASTTYYKVVGSPIQAGSRLIPEGSEIVKGTLPDNDEVALLKLGILVEV